VKYLKYFTLKSQEEIDDLEKQTRDVALAGLREAQRRLAFDVTSRVHGQPAARAAKDASEFLFAGGSPAVLPDDAWNMVKREVPNGSVDLLPTGTVDVVSLLVSGGLAQSRGAARRLVQQGGVTVNGRRLGPEELAFPADSAVHGRYFLVKKGARDYAVLELVR
jgi:tyrosyl-tRNA synthetase